MSNAGFLTLFISKIGTTELLLILVVVLLIFGPKYLPRLGRTMGDTIKGFKDGISEDDAAASKKDSNPNIEVVEKSDKDVEEL